MIQLRRIINVVVPLVLGTIMIAVGIPRERIPEAQQQRRDQLVDKLRTLSLSQNWSMYAPDPARGHFYLELEAHDRDGTVRLLEDSRMASEGWGTAWAWRRTRLDIWQHAVARRIDKVSRNRTWYMRGVCMREARRGYDVRHVEMRRVYRRIRSPERVREGAEILGPLKRRDGQDGSCNVAIIRKMIKADRERRGVDHD